jgi:hypothetical protein
MSEPKTIDLVKSGASYGPARQSSLRRAISLGAALTLLFSGLFFLGKTLYAPPAFGFGWAALAGLTMAITAGYWIYEDFIRAVPTED